MPQNKCQIMHHTALFRRAKSFVEMHRLLKPFLNFNQLPAAKKGYKNGASQQTFGPSYFERGLETETF